jgi:putative membrane protein
MTDGKRHPQAFVIDAEDDERPARGKGPKITFAPDEPQGEVVVVPPAPLPSPRRIRWVSILVGALFTLFSLWAGLAITTLIEDVFARSALLGWLALGVAGLAGLSALAIIAREIWGLLRLSRIEHIQRDAAHAINTDDKDAALRTIAHVKGLYRNRPDAQWGLRQLSEHAGDILDPRDRVRLAERYLVEPRDAEAHRIIARAARRVTLLTTVTPAAALDILFVAAQNLRMLRELATLYGGRPSTLATLRLARLVVGHLAVTGGLALSDNLLQHVVGRGLLGRLSARFGEGAVNGMLTSRIGLAAVDVCRPVPLAASARETLASLLKELVNIGGGDGGEEKS